MPDGAEIGARALNFAARIAEQDRLRREARGWQEEDIAAQRAHEMGVLSYQAGERAREQARGYQYELGAMGAKYGYEAPVTRARIGALRGQTELYGAQGELMGAQAEALRVGPQYDIYGEFVRRGWRPPSGEYQPPPETGLPELAGPTYEDEYNLAQYKAVSERMDNLWRAIEASAKETGYATEQFIDMLNNPKDYPAFTEMIEQKKRSLWQWIRGEERDPSAFVGITGQDPIQYMMGLVQQHRGLTQALGIVGAGALPSGAEQLFPGGLLRPYAPEEGPTTGPIVEPPGLVEEREAAAAAPPMSEQQIQARVRELNQPGEIIERGALEEAWKGVVGGTRSTIRTRSLSTRLWDKEHEDMIHALIDAFMRKGDEIDRATAIYLLCKEDRDIKRYFDKNFSTARRYNP